ncbi:MAG: hypothetical protein ABFS12_15160 [Bacteroidota bacterium]
MKFIEKYTGKILVLFLIPMLLLVNTCGDDEITSPDNGGDPGGSDFGKTTSVVIIVNPKINEGSTTTVKSGTQRENVSIKAADLETVSTDPTGLAVIKDLPADTVSLKFSSRSIDLNVVQEKELYDVVVSYTSNGVEEIIPAVRYPIGGTVITVKPGDDLNDSLKADDIIVYMEPGIYNGDVTINAEGVLLFGSWDEVEGSESIINGKLMVNGGNVRMRGVTVDSLTTVRANGFSAAFCEFNNADISGNLVSLLRNIFNGTNVKVPSSSAVLLDNKNLL